MEPGACVAAWVGGREQKLGGAWCLPHPSRRFFRAWRHEPRPPHVCGIPGTSCLDAGLGCSPLRAWPWGSSVGPGHCALRSWGP